MKKTILISAIALLLVVGTVGAITMSPEEVKTLVNDNTPLNLGGGDVPYDYVYTPTAGESAQLLKTRFGSLGSVIITGAGAGYIDIYNASTTDATLRTVTATTSLPTIAHFPANTVAGTYDFNTIFTDGLLVVWTGDIGTSTITYK